jgi:hypothetical protein
MTRLPSMMAPQYTTGGPCKPRRPVSRMSVRIRSDRGARALATSKIWSDVMWERRHIDGTIYRHDNMPHAQWQGVSSFPKHFHVGDQETNVFSPLIVLWTA